RFARMNVLISSASAILFTAATVLKRSRTSSGPSAGNSGRHRPKRPCRFMSIASRSGREVIATHSSRPRRLESPMCAANAAKIRSGILEVHQTLAIFLDQSLLARRDVIGGHPRPIADGLGQEVLGAQEIQTGGAQGEVGGFEIAPIAKPPSARHGLGPTRLEKSQPVLGVGQVDLYLRHMRVLQQVGAQFGG